MPLYSLTLLFKLYSEFDATLETNRVEPYSEKGKRCCIICCINVASLKMMQHLRLLFTLTCCITQKMMQHLIQHSKMYIYSIFIILNVLNFHLLHKLSVHHNLFQIEFSHFYYHHIQTNCLIVLRCLKSF
ncbi:hypothetical protein M6K066_0853 [Staphylococcus aureus]|nr:hypothetical protein M6K066_0853 [Staphylococcus aureus]